MSNPKSDNVVSLRQSTRQKKIKTHPGDEGDEMPLLKKTRVTKIKKPDPPTGILL